MVEGSTLELLELHRSTVFAVDSRGRMVHENDPGRSRGKRFNITGCQEGNLFVCRDDVSDESFAQLERLTVEEPPLASRDAVVLNLRGYLATLGEADAGVDALHGYLWVFPTVLRAGVDAELVFSGSVEGDRLLERLPDAMPESLVARGFGAPTDLWAPWCVAVVSNRIASIAQTVRTGPGGAEVGVDTALEHRGRGLAGAATAGWARHPALGGAMLFYSTNRLNLSSCRVTERLGLLFVGTTFAIP